jgi:hypothetical protein
MLKDEDLNHWIEWEKLKAKWDPILNQDFKPLPPDKKRKVTAVLL